MVEISKGQVSEQGAKQPGARLAWREILFSVPRAESRKTVGGFVDLSRAKTVDVFLAKKCPQWLWSFSWFLCLVHF